MVNFWRQLKFLLWKCVLVKRRQKFWLTVELVVPCILFIVIALVRTRNFDESEPQCHYDSKGMLSAGILPFIHSFFCSFSNKCSQIPTTGDEQRFLFNDNGNMTRNESIVVDFIHYSALQLRWIGEHPKEFNELVTVSSEMVHYLAKLETTTDRIFKIGDLFDSDAHPQVIHALGDAGISQTTSEKLLDARVGTGLLENRQKIEDSFSGFFGIFSNPLFCDDAIFKSVFHFEKGKELTEDEKNELCENANILELGSYDNLLLNASIPTPSRSRIVPTLKTFRNVFQPSFQFFDKYSNLTTNTLVAALFCGNNPMDVIEQVVNPDNEGQVETPLDKMRKAVIKFIQTVSPGKQEHKNGTCIPVTYHEDLNCTALEGSMLGSIRPILQGFILVSPDNTATRKLIDILNLPLRNVEFVRDLLYNWPSQATNFQLALHKSDFWPASQNLLKILNTTQKIDPNLEFLLQHTFANPTDPYSFGSISANLTRMANMYTSCFLVDRFRFVTNETEMEKNAMCLMEEKQFFSGIVFNMTENSTNFEDFTEYKIRHFPNFVDSTSGLMDSRSNPFSRHRPLLDLKYITYGFSFLQESIDRALISLKTNGTQAELGTYAQQEPFPCITKDKFNVALFMPLFLLISFLFPSSLLVKNIVYEKELRIKEQMRAMGLGDAVHFISWAIVSLVLNFISVLVISLITKFAKIFNNTDYTLLLVILILFLFSSIAMSIFFSTLFTNANIATAATCVLWFVFFIPFQLKSDAVKTPTFNRICLLLPPTAMGHVFKLLEAFNAVERGSWSDLHDMVNPVYGLSVELCMVMLLVDTVIFLILAWYISAVAPGEYGVRQPFYFPLTMRYWFPNFYKNKVEFIDEEHFDIIQTGDNFDTEPHGMKLTVHINSMSKVYESGTKALDCLNLRLYENQITGLLGHNGAGKTTTMSILCGLYSPSSGTAKIYSRDIRTDLRKVREVLGICPQHNVLFTHLTVSEQLRLFAALKGVDDKDLDNQVNDILASVSLTEKANKLASTLSGGMKRRLCIGIAFIGGSKFVILDEPTAGVDVSARKDIWKLLQKNKEGRTILLSTHHMDEADVLSDRIAILSQGQCITVGSSVFLKRRFGNTMTLTIVKQASAHDYTNVTNHILELGQDIRVEIDDENEEEIVFKIPIQTDSDSLEQFFTKLDINMEQYKLGQYGISAPTLQKIFVSLAPQKEYHVPKVSRWLCFKKLKRKIFRWKNSEEHSDLIVGNNLDAPPTPMENNMPATNPLEEIKFEDFEKPELLTGYWLTMQHIWALLVCRMNYTLRSKKTFLFQVIIPMCLLAVGEIYVLIQLPSSRPDLVVSQSPLPLETGLFGNHSDFYVNNWDTKQNSTSNSILQAMFESPGTGPRCAIGDPKMAFENSFECQNVQGEFNYKEDVSNVTYNAPIYCGCEDFGWNCTLEDWQWNITNYIRLNTTDRIFDITGRNISQFRMITRIQQISNNTAPFFLGGYSLGHLNNRAQTQQQIDDSKQGWSLLLKELAIASNIVNLNTSNLDPDAPRIKDPFIRNITMTELIDAILGNLDTKENVKVWFNNKIWPSFPIASNILSNSLLRKEDTLTDPDQLGILVLNHPMNKTVEQTLSASSTNFAQSLSLFRITCLLLCLSMIPAGFTVYLVEDRVCEAFHLQMVGGLKKRTYWITSYIYDTTVYLCVVIVIMLIYLIFKVPEFSRDSTTFFVFLLTFFVYGMCMILYAYVLQKRFTIAALSFVLIAIGCYFIGIVCALTVILIENLMRDDATLVPAHTVCSIVFLIIPQYNLGLAIYRGSMVYQVEKIGANFLESINRPDLTDQLPLPELLQMNVMGLHVLCLFIHVFVAAGCLIFSQMDEFSFMRRREREDTENMMLHDQTNDIDEDVIREKNRVDGIPHNVHNYTLVVRNLAKAYTNEQLAVRGISFAVEAGECFGLLGLNGAGKTTTFSMLTAKIWPGHGIIEMGDTRITPVSFSSNQNFQNLGYCPQFDALNMKLTTRQNLKFFARVRGIKPNQIDQIIDRLLVALHLRPYSNTQTSSLSGGNRRKLSVAVALVSQPSLVYLDEPSAGMDPGSQQFLWKVIERLCKSGKAVVLTSHSMEECEALCTRIAIMDRGRIRCLGGKQHLKNKFGKGSMLTIKMANAEEAVDVGEILKFRIEGSRLEAIHCSTVFVHIDQGTSTVAQILKVVNQVKRSYHFEDYTLTQSTLDNVFQSISENPIIQSTIPTIPTEHS